MPRFSIIVPTRDRPDLLREAVRSALDQTIEDLEVIIVDDGSEQSLPRWDDPRVRIVRNDRPRGVAAARNRGLELAEGKFVTFLDDDDVLTPERLAIGERGLERAPVAICWTRFLDGAEAPNRLLEGDVSDIIVDSSTPAMGAAVVRRDLAPWLDEAFIASQDIDWWIRLAQGVPVATESEIGYLIRRHPGVRRGNDLEARVRFGMLLLEKHADYFATHRGAAGFRWWRIGSMAETVGDKPTARRAYARSLILRPRPGTARRLIGTLVPGRPMPRSKAGGRRGRGHRPPLAR